DPVRSRDGARLAEGSADLRDSIPRLQLRPRVRDATPAHRSIQRNHQRLRSRDMNETTMMHFVGRAVDDVGALLGGAMVVLGDKLGLYRAMRGAGSLTAGELATRTGTSERYV